MAKGKKTGGRDFSSGNTGGPGRPPLPDDLRAMRKINRVELEHALNRLLNLRETELLNLLTDEATPSLEKIVASGITRAIKEGDFVRLNFLLERLVGKVPQPVASNIDPALIDTIIKLEGKSDAELLTILNIGATT